MNKLHFRLLKWFCPPGLLEEIEGDLLQRFARDTKLVGEKKAKRKLFWNTIRFFRSGVVLRNKFLFSKNLTIMWHHYLLTYWRNASKNKITYALNLTGLVIGLASALVMSLFIESELNFDCFDGSENLYRVVYGADDNTGSVHTPFVLGTELMNSYPAVKAIRFNNAGNARVNFKRDDRQFTETSFYFTDAEALQVLPFKLIHGQPSSCLVDPFTVVISQETAWKFFGDVNPVGRFISMNWIDQDYELKVTGLFDKSSYHSHISFDYLISISTAERLFRPQSFFTDWTANYNVTYLLIENPSTASVINDKISSIYQNHIVERTSDFSNLRLQPFNRIHLYSHLGREISANTDVKYLYLAASIGILILVVCLINYTNLISASFTTRLKEIGVRKSFGGGRSVILRQFLGESMANIIIALVLSVATVSLVLPYLSNRIGSEWTILQLIQIPGVWISIVALLIFGILSGIYPSIVMSSQNAGAILYGRMKMTLKGIWVQNGLVTLQLFIALFILMGALIVREQLIFMQEKDLGYNQESLLTIPHGRAIRERSEFIKNEMARGGKIISSTLSSQLPSRGLGFKVPSIVEGGNPDGTNEPWPVSLISVDYDFFQTFGLQLLEGRTFSSQFPSDSTEAFVINEAVARELNWQSPIGKNIEMTYNAGDGTVETRKGKVIGVIKDFNFESLHESIEPIVFMCKPFWFYYVTFRLTPGTSIADIESLSEKWKTLEPDKPFEYTFMTDRLEQLYTTERAWSDGINFIAILVTGISCLGILGLISFLVQSRTREIAVRKILGAESISIFLKLYLPLLLMILIAVVGALPAAWYSSHLWLQGFAYRVDIGMSVFVVSVFIVALVSTLSVASLLIKASRQNPIDVLKSE